MKKSLLDTDILSEVLKGRNPIVATYKTAYLRDFGYFTTSVVNVMEVVRGFQRIQSESRIQQFLATLANAEVLILDRDAAESAGRIHGDLERIGQTNGFADSAIAAIALQHDLTLVTGNTVHYQRIQALGYNLQLDNWRV